MMRSRNSFRLSSFGCLVSFVRTSCPLCLALGFIVFSVTLHAQTNVTTVTPSVPPNQQASTSNPDVVPQGDAAPSADPQSAQSNGPVYRSTNGKIVPQGSSIPGLGGIPSMLNGPAYIEAGADDSGLTGPDAGPNARWNDGYIRGAVSSERNVFNFEFVRERRFQDAGWYYGGGWTRVLSPTWYSEFSAGSSIGGFTIPHLRLDGLIHKKLMPRKQLVTTTGVGYDKSKTLNSAMRGTAELTYYFDRFPLVADAGVTMTHANPGNIWARSQFVSLSEGHDKEHFISLRYEFGHEGYELIGSRNAPTALFNFPVRNYSANWRQWIGLNWGINISYEHEGNPHYHRNGGLIGIFLDF